MTGDGDSMEAMNAGLRDAIADVLAGVRFPATQFHDEAVRLVVNIEAEMVAAAVRAFLTDHPGALVEMGVLERCPDSETGRQAGGLVCDSTGLPLYRSVKYAAVGLVDPKDGEPNG